MARTFLGYEENRGARHVLVLLVIAFALCLAGILAGGIGSSHALQAEDESSIMASVAKLKDEGLDKLKDEGMTWLASSDSSDNENAADDGHRQGKS